MEKKTYRLEMDKDEIYQALQCIRLDITRDMEVMWEIAHECIRDGEDWKPVVENQQKVIKYNIDLHNKMIDQCRAQIAGRKSADEWNRLKDDMEAAGRTLDFYTQEIELDAKKAAISRRPKLDIVK